MLSVKKFKEILRKLKKSKSGNSDWWKEDLKVFCKESDIPALKDATQAYRSNHYFIKILWIIFFVVGTVLTAYFIYADVSDYNENPTATRVYTSRNASYPLPPIYFGATQMQHHADEWKEMGLSQGGIQYVNSLNLQKRNFMNVSLYNDSRNEFQHFAKSNNLSLWSDLFLTTAQDYAYDFRVRCDDCYRNDEFEPAKFVPFLGTYSITVLYEIPFNPATPSWVRTSDTDLGMEFSLAKNNSDQYYLAIGKPYNLVTVDDLMPIWPSFDYDIRINVYRFQSQNKYGNCRPSVDSNNGSYHPKLCADKCTNNDLRACGKCRKLAADDPIEISNKSYPNEYCSTLKHNVKCIHNAKIEAAIIKCTLACLPLCDQTVYEYSVVNVPSFDNRIKITFYPTYADAGVLTYEEIPTYTFESAVSNVGGQLGLWLGFSVVNFVQIVLYWLNAWLQKDNVDTLKYEDSIRKKGKISIDKKSDLPPTYSVSTLSTLV